MTAMMSDTLSMFSLGISKTRASLYVGLRVFFFMDVFLFFSLRPSQTRDAFTYGSEKNSKSEGERKFVKEIATAGRNALPTLKLMLITASIIIELAITVH